MTFKSLILATLVSVSCAAFGQAYPNKPIKAIVPFAAGSATGGCSAKSTRCAA